MEINDLKTIWKKASDQQVQGYWVSKDDVKAMVKKKSKASIADVTRQLKQKVRMSSVISLVALVIGITNLLEFDSKDEFILDGVLSRYQYGSMMIFLAAVILAISIHARIRYRQIKSLENTSDPLRVTLTKTKEIFGKVIKAGTLSDAIVNPILILFAMAVKLYSDTGFALDSRLLLMLGVGGAFYFLFYQLGKFMMNRKFGRFITALNDRLAELEATDSENNSEEV